MNSRKRVIAAMNHQETDRTPVDFDCSQEDKVEELISFFGVSDKEAMLRLLGVDTRWCVYMDDLVAKNRFDRDETYIDIWGVERHVRGLYPISHPLAEAVDLSDLESYPWPDPAEMDFSGHIERMKLHADFAVFGGLWSPWMEVADALLGTEEFMIRMLTEPEFIEALLDRLVAFYLAANKRFFAEAGNLMQIFHCGDDYGMQQNLLWSPECWRRFVKPRQKKLYDLAHQHGYKVMQHSCGSIVQVIPDLIEIGLDGLQPIQVTAAGMDPEILKARFGKNLLFMGGVNGQGVILHGTPDDVGDEVRLRIKQLGSDGGYIVSTSQGIMPDMPNENVAAMYAAVSMQTKHAS